MKNTILLSMSAICITTIFTLSSQSQATLCGEPVTDGCDTKACPTEWEVIKNPQTPVEACDSIGMSKDTFKAQLANGRWGQGGQCGLKKTGTIGSDCTTPAGGCGGSLVTSNPKCPNSLPNGE